MGRIYAETVLRIFFFLKKARDFPNNIRQTTPPSQIHIGGIYLTDI
jgi:hypothetical protein